MCFAYDLSSLGSASYVIDRFGVDLPIPLQIIDTVDPSNAVTLLNSKIMGGNRTFLNNNIGKNYFEQIIFDRSKEAKKI